MNRQIGCALVLMFVFVIGVLAVLSFNNPNQKQRPEFPTFHR